MSCKMNHILDSSKDLAYSHYATIVVHCNSAINAKVT